MPSMPCSFCLMFPLGRRLTLLPRPDPLTGENARDGQDHNNPPIVWVRMTAVPADYAQHDHRRNDTGSNRNPNLTACGRHMSIYADRRPPVRTAALERASLTVRLRLPTRRGLWRQVY